MRNESSLAPSLASRVWLFPYRYRQNDARTRRHLSFPERQLRLRRFAAKQLHDPSISRNDSAAIQSAKRSQLQVKSNRGLKARQDLDTKWNTAA